MIGEQTTQYLSACQVRRRSNEPCYWKIADNPQLYTDNFQLNEMLCSS